MPWVTLITGCVAGMALLAILARVAEHAHAQLGQGAGRIAFVPAIAALAFVVRDPLRPLTGATPVPAWAVQAGHLLLAAPVLAITCWAQLRIIAGTFPPGGLSRPPAVYPVIAQLAGWCAITVAAAACADRSRYADLGGAVAVAVSRRGDRAGLVRAGDRALPGRTARLRARRDSCLVRHRRRRARSDRRSDAGSLASLYPRPVPAHASSGATPGN